MKKIIFLGLFALLAFMACNFGNNEVTDAQSYQTAKNEMENTITSNQKNLVLVELFTSEG
ncbi:MAG: hypothetical protein M3405_14520 [Acidobacteriota bacterium]|jgi:hypothetical protein|nr:hypothetical protein [Acidobacteriota bacterium]